MRRLRLKAARKRWWRKPLVQLGRHTLPAELVVLAAELRHAESGAWLNSRGLASGVADLIPDKSTASGFRTQRIALPAFVASTLRRIYRASGLRKGCPDLVIWSEKAVRLVEVKCPHWDKPSPEQELFMRFAEKTGVRTRIVEWEFQNGAS